MVPPVWPKSIAPDIINMMAKIISNHNTLNAHLNRFSINGEKTQIAPKYCYNNTEHLLVKLFWSYKKYFQNLKSLIS